MCQCADLLKDDGMNDLWRGNGQKEIIATLEHEQSHSRLADSRGWRSFNLNVQSSVNVWTLNSLRFFASFTNAFHPANNVCVVGNRSHKQCSNYSLLKHFTEDEYIAILIHGNVPVSILSSTTTGRLIGPHCLIRPRWYFRVYEDFKRNWVRLRRAMLAGDYAGVDAVTKGWGFGLPDLMASFTPMKPTVLRKGRNPKKNEDGTEVKK